MTVAEVKKINEGCANGFKLDVQRYAFYKEKEFQKYIKLEDDSMLRVKIEWYACRDVRHSDYGQSFSVPNGMSVPKIHFSVWRESGSCLVSHGLGRWVDIEGQEPVKRKSYKKLQELTKNFDDAKCLQMFKEAEKTIPNMME